MEGVELSYFNVCVRAIIEAFLTLSKMSVKEALMFVKYGKGDTRGLDATAEAILIRKVKQYDSRAIFVTEEFQKKELEKWLFSSDPDFLPDAFFSDPIDRTKFLVRFIIRSLEKILGLDLLSTDDKTIMEEINKADNSVKSLTVRDLLIREDARETWEQSVAEAPASITGPTTSITYLKKGKLIFSIIFNFITFEICAAFDRGIKRFKFDSCMGIDDVSWSEIYRRGDDINFPPWPRMSANDDDLRCVTFLGKAGYSENFRDSKIIDDDPENHVYHSEPGGPSRISYLSNMHEGYPPVGLIIANGEKIGEWIHWLPFVKFSKGCDGQPALNVFEVSAERPWVKDGVLMSTPRAYSIFNCFDDQKYIDLSQLKNLNQPNHFRSTIVIVPSGNNRVYSILIYQNCREVSAYL
jgi:hypothetical protein